MKGKAKQNNRSFLSVFTKWYTIFYMSIIHHANQLGIVIVEINPYIHNLLTYLLRYLLTYLWGYKIYLLAKIGRKR